MPQTPHTDQQHRAILRSIAHGAMLQQYIRRLKSSRSIRRVVRTPKRWDRIVELAHEHEITQRLLKAAIAGRAAPYSYAELDVLAEYFTTEEDAANKVERQVGKSAAALLLESRSGELNEPPEAYRASTSVARSHR